MLLQVIHGVGPLEVARVDDADRNEDDVLEMARRETQGIEQRMNAQPAVAADQNRGGG